MTESSDGLRIVVLDVFEVTCFGRPSTLSGNLSKHTLTRPGPKNSSPSMIPSMNKSSLQACTAVFRHLLQEVLSSNMLQAQCASPAEKASQGMRRLQTSLTYSTRCGRLSRSVIFSFHLAAPSS